MATQDNTGRLKFGRPALFRPNVVRNMKEGASNSVYLDRSSNSGFSDSAMGVTGTFKYNPQDDGLVSTQQLNIDWSDFANHTFYNSAQVKTNIAFDKIINEFPFDGTREEVEVFFDKMTGFEKWIFDRFPKKKNYLYFSGSASGSFDGSAVIVKDIAGAQFPTLSKVTTGISPIDPGLKSMTVEMHLFVPSQSLGDQSQPIIMKQSGSNGFGVVLETTTGSLQPSVSFLVVSGALEDKVALDLDYDTWNHVQWTWNRTPGIELISGYKNTSLLASSSMPIEFGTLGTAGSDLLVGSGSALGTFTPTSTFSGSIDELRIWHTVRTTAERKQYQAKPVYADDNLRLYFKFNEPTGSNSNLVLDHSGKSVHGRLNARALTLGVREVGNINGDSPMTNELLELNPVLFPSVQESVSLRSGLLTSASLFDDQNPSLITRLIPPHYLQDGQDEQSLATEEGDIINAPSGSTNPGDPQLGSTQVLLSLLYTWAKFFDEMKLFLQAFGTMRTVDYDEIDTIPNDFLSVFARNEGIDLPPLFVGSSIEQYIDGDNLDNSISKNVLGLQSIQNQIWRRILINLKDVLASKGTIHSIKSFLRTVGINPDSSFRIREYGGPTRRPLSFNREKRFEVATMLNFVSGGFLTTPALSASRTEVGIPFAGPNSADNALLTSGSFTFEGTYRFPAGRTYPTTQSLGRVQISGSGGHGLLLNSVLTPNGVSIFAKPDSFTSSSMLTMEITGANLLDGDRWYVSFGRQRNDRIASNVSSSYFLRLAKQGNGEIIESYTTASYFADFQATSRWQNATSSFDGPYFVIGSSSIPAGTLHLNTSSVGVATKSTLFEGRLAQIRFWSKFLEENEWKEHVLNYRSVGVTDPRKNFNFAASNVSGSWERLRIDASTDQIVTQSNSGGEIFLTDFTQNDFVFSGSNFPVTKSVIEPERFNYSYISSKIDEGVTDNKVRIRSFLDFEKVLSSPWASSAPTHDITPSETPSDSSRLSIDFSIVDALDQDIMTIFSSLDEMNNILGNPELQFSNNYPELEVLREVYFNKLEGKIRLKGFFEFYKWFDTNVGNFVEQLVPRKTKYLGSNYVIESHFLERAKIEHQFEDIYLGEDIRSGLKDTILLQLIEGSFGKY